MVEFMKKMIRNKIFLAIISIVIGLILVIRQKDAADSLVRLTGIILLIAAVVFLIMYFAKKDKHVSMIILSIVGFIVGIIFTVKPDLIVSAFPFLIGIILVISGALDFWHSIKAPKETRGKILLILISILVILVGILCIVQPGAVANVIILFVGLCLVFNGVFDLILLVFIRDDTKSDIKKAE